MLITFPELRSKNLSRCRRWHPGGLSDWSLSDWGIALAGEVGELLNVAKKLNRDRDGITGNSRTRDELRQDLADEIADVAIYLDILAASEGIDLAKAIAEKFNATSAKVGFPERLGERDSDGPTTSSEVASIASALLQKPAHELVGLGGDAAHELREQIRTVAASALGQHR